MLGYSLVKILMMEMVKDEYCLIIRQRTQRWINDTLNWHNKDPRERYRRKV